MRWHLTTAAAASLPARETLLEAQDLPGDGDLAPRLGRLVEESVHEYLALATPCAVVEDIEPEAFRAVLHGEGRNLLPLPLEPVIERAEGLALFVATIGPAVPAAISRWFAARDPARGYMLDGIASAAADGLSLWAAREWAERRFGGCAPGSCALPYSPGYCGWDVSGQRALFAALRPSETGVRLNDSCLMLPLKSVSGVLVYATAAAHRMRQDYPCCETCLTRDCEGRVELVAQAKGIDGIAGPGMCT
jgi:hypothetical protein